MKVEEAKTATGYQQIFCCMMKTCQPEKMKRLLANFITFLLAIATHANHISGGEMSYTLVSQSGNNYTYSISLKLFRDALGGGPALGASEAIAIYAKGTNALVWQNNAVPRTSFNTI